MHVSSYLALGYMNCEATVDECLSLRQWDIYNTSYKYYRANDGSWSSAEKFVVGVSKVE